MLTGIAARLRRICILPGEIRKQARQGISHYVPEL